MTSSERFYACEYSRQMGEQIFGTATRADVWLLLEYSGGWAYNAFPDSDLPDSVKNHLSDALAATPKSRLELIKQSRSTSPAELAFYVAIAGELKATLYSFRLNAYEDLLKFNIPDIAAGDQAYDEFISQEPVFLVCTNGRRDSCCARFGMPVYDAMSRYARGSAWQCTHLGGHRFAANAVFLPFGICYGRLDDRDVEPAIAQYHRRQIYLDRYRGRSCYDKVAHAADYFLRLQTGSLGFQAFHLDTVQTLDTDTWIVQFESLADRRMHQIRLQQEKPGIQIYENSGDAEPVWVPQYRFVDHTVVGG